MSKSSVTAWVLAALIPPLGLVTASWLVLPARTFANCMEPELKLPGLLITVTVASVLLSAAAFIAGSLSRRAGLALLIVLVLLALGAYFVGGWFISDNYFPEYVESRAACGRSAADVAAWGWPIAVPLVMVALSAAAGLLRKRWSVVVGALVVAALSLGLVLTLTEAVVIDARSSAVGKT